MIWAQGKEDESKLCWGRKRKKKNVYSVYCTGRTMWAGQVTVNPCVPLAEETLDFGLFSLSELLAGNMYM